MARNQSPAPRDVEQAYKEVKALLPGLGTLSRNSTRDWYIGTEFIGGTAREALACIHGMLLAHRYGPMLAA